jgi:hypothetical protein
MKFDSQIKVYYLEMLKKMYINPEISTSEKLLLR